MQLIPLVDCHVDLSQPLAVGDAPGPLGQRLIFDARGGTFHGARLNGAILPSGGDWALAGPDRVLRLDVRSTFKTDDGAVIYHQALGILVITDQVDHAMKTGGQIDFGETYFMCQPRFETGDRRYAWLNALVAVGEMRFGPGWVEYRIFQVAN